MHVVWKVENGPVLMEPDLHGDSRGYFFESYNKNDFKELTGYDVNFIQDNESKSSYGVLRGLHFQEPPFAQAKLVRVVKGAVLDVAVDIRNGSPTYGLLSAAYLTEENKRQFFIPQGFAHGFLSLKDDTIFQYKCDNVYNKDSEGGIAWNTTLLAYNNGIPWKDYINVKDIILSEKDTLHPDLTDFVSPFDFENNDIDEQ